MEDEKLSGIQGVEKRFALIGTGRRSEGSLEEGRLGDDLEIISKLVFKTICLGNQNDSTMGKAFA